MGDATLIEVRENLVFYSYDVRGVEYTASQDCFRAPGVIAFRSIRREWRGLYEVRSAESREFDDRKRGLERPAEFRLRHAIALKAVAAAPGGIPGPYCP